MDEIELMDIADELLIINKHTIDTLMELENCADCIALYVFYYKTAKWQKTNQIKASDEYARKCLKWGRSKIEKTKAILKEHGLIDIVQERNGGKILGWYIKVSYLVQKKSLEDCHVIIQKHQNQQVVNSTCGFRETNALKYNNNCFKTDNEMLKVKGARTTNNIINIKSYSDNPRLNDAINEFIKFRKEIKKPMTDRAISLMMTKLDVLSNSVDEQIEILNQSILNGWQGIFALKTDNKQTKKPNQMDALQEWREKYNDR